MAADNSTGDLHAPGTQLSVTDIIVIAVYFALNVAVGIWVRACSDPLGPAHPWVSADILFGGLLPQCQNCGDSLAVPKVLVQNLELGGCLGPGSS